MASERFQEPKGPPWNGSPKGECTDLRDPLECAINTDRSWHASAYGIVCTLRHHPAKSTWIGVISVAIIKLRNADGALQSSFVKRYEALKSKQLYL
jgi:hypothetical protein